MQRHTRATRHLAAAAALLALAMAAPPATAQDAAPQGDVTKDATTMLYNAGIDAARAEQWEKAYESFLAAFKIKQHPQIAVNLGRAAVKAGRPREAAEYLTFFLRETKDQVGNQDRAAVQQLLLEAKGKIGTLIVKVNKPGADVVVDGKVVGQAPLRDDVFVDPGKHTVEARLGKEQAEPLTVELKAGDSRQVGLAVGSVGSEAGEGEKPAEKPKQDSGSARIFGDPEPKWLIVGGAATGAGVISGIVFTVLAESQKDKWENDLSGGGCYGSPPLGANCDEVEKTRDQEDLFRNIGFWSFIGAGTVGAATIVYAFVAPKRRPNEARTRVIPVATLGGGGLGVVGRW